jgi:crotonobetainyl-CoA:carnitine CoA-transferase CaiB-like acyl-CoA transferase
MINRNKRSVAINLKVSAGRDLVLALVKDADVLLQNYRPGKMARLGLDYDALRAINPNLVYASINGMGEIGPLADQKVYDYVIQGVSGLLDSYQAGAGGGDLQLVRTIIYDKVTALTAAQGITAALLARERGAGGQHVQLSMLDAALYFNWPDLMWNYSFKGQGVNFSPDLADMCEVNETKDGAVITSYLGADTSGYDTDQLLQLLAENEIPVGRVNRRREVMQDAQVRASGTVLELEHPRGGALLQPRAAVRFDGTPIPSPAPSAELGEHTVEVLAELGLSLDEMQTLAHQGAIG